MRSQVLCLSLLLGGMEAKAAPASADAVMEAYRADQEIAGEIRIWASPVDRGLIEALQAGFAVHHPMVNFGGAFHGPESTVAGVYTGVADLAFMARELREPLERMAFQWVLLERPFEVEIANAGFDPARPATQLAVFVHQDNPLQSLSLTSLDAIYGAEHRRGSRNVRAWGDLGLADEWSSRTIRVMGPALDGIAALFFRRAVLKDSRKWNPGYHEFASDEAILDALSADRRGIAFAPFARRVPGLKVLRLSIDDGDPAHAPSRETVIERSYPLSRVVSVALHRADGQPLEPRLHEFLRFVLSADGQHIVDRHGAYLPLSVADASRQRRRLQ